LRRARSTPTAWGEARELAAEGLEVAEERAGRFFGWYFRYLQALLAAVQGRFDTSRALAGQVIGWAGPRGVGLAQVWAHHALELADLGAGDFEGGPAEIGLRDQDETT
jgi:hypothetical protein